MPRSKTTAARVDEAYKRLVKLYHVHDVHVGEAGKVPSVEDLERDGYKVTAGLTKLIQGARDDAALVKAHLGTIPPYPPRPVKPEAKDKKDTKGRGK